jgi:hypothetical protein
VVILESKRARRLVGDRIAEARVLWWIERRPVGGLESPGRSVAEPLSIGRTLSSVKIAGSRATAAWKFNTLKTFNVKRTELFDRARSSSAIAALISEKKYGEKPRARENQGSDVKAISPGLTEGRVLCGFARDKFQSTSSGCTSAGGR